MDTKEKLKVLFVGVGGFGSYLWKITHDHVDREAFEVCAVVDPYRKTAECYGEIQALALPEYDDLDSFFRDGKVDADVAIISSPIPRHREQTIACLRQGIHVLCEKPAAALVEDLDAMIAAAKEENRLLGIGFQWTFFDETLAIKKDLMEKKFGEILFAKSMVSWPRNRSYYESSWKGRMKNDAGEYVFDSIIQNATAHYLHNLLFLCGDRWNRPAYLKEMKAALYRAKDIESFDTVSLTGDLGGGRKLLYIASHAVDQWIDPIYEITCEKGRFGIDMNHASPRFFAEDEQGNREYYGPVMDGEYYNSIKISKFLKAVQSFRETGNLPELPCDGETARAHLEAINRLAFGAKIHLFPEDMIRTYDTEEFQGRFVPGLSQVIYDCYQKNQPLSRGEMKGLVPEEEVKPLDQLLTK